MGEVNRLRRHTHSTGGVPPVSFSDYYDAEVEGQLRILKQYHDSEVFAIYFLPVVGLSSRYQTFRQALEILDILRWEKSV